MKDKASLPPREEVRSLSFLRLFAFFAAIPFHENHPHSKHWRALMRPLRFMAATHVNILEVFSFHEQERGQPCPREISLGPNPR